MSALRYESGELGTGTKGTEKGIFYFLKGDGRTNAGPSPAVVSLNPRSLIPLIPPEFDLPFSKIHAILGNI